jgi:hypothetical protein
MKEPDRPVHAAAADFELQLHPIFGPLTEEEWMRWGYTAHGSSPCGSLAREFPVMRLVGYW